MRYRILRTRRVPAGRLMHHDSYAAHHHIEPVPHRAPVNHDTIALRCPRCGPIVEPRAATPVMIVRGGESIDERELCRSLVFTDGRRLPQDPAFTIRCVVDVALRALSPTINDRAGAVEGFDALEALLRRLATSAADASAIVDRSGVIRIVLFTLGWQELVNLALTEVRWWGTGPPPVARRLSAALDSLEEAVSPERRAVVTRHRRLLEQHLERSYDDPLEPAFEITADRLGIGGAGVRAARAAGPGSGLQGA
jgi:uncharacterized membrane protein